MKEIVKEFYKPVMNCDSTIGWRINEFLKENNKLSIKNVIDIGESVLVIFKEFKNERQNKENIR